MFLVLVIKKPVFLSERYVMTFCCCHSVICYDDLFHTACSMLLPESPNAQDRAINTRRNSTVDNGPAVSAVMFLVHKERTDPEMLLNRLVFI